MVIYFVIYKRAFGIFCVSSLLLITTLFRMGLNISSTVYTRRRGGRCYKTFGSFVIRGNIVVGFVVLIIIIMQFIV